MQACDWTVLRSWVFLLCLGLAIGTVAGAVFFLVSALWIGLAENAVAHDRLIKAAGLGAWIFLAMVLDWLVVTRAAAYMKPNAPHPLSPRSYKLADVIADSLLYGFFLAAIALPVLAVALIFFNDDSDAYFWAVLSVFGVSWFLIGNLPDILKRWCPPNRIGQS